MAINTTQFMNDLAQFNKNATKNGKFYNSELRSILDKHAHQRERKNTIRATLPWFTEKSCHLKHATDQGKEDREETRLPTMITPSDMPNGPLENILDTCITNTSISIQK